jgi:ribosomal protein S18 acetylase RimI-like enzyme
MGVNDGVLETTCGSFPIDLATRDQALRVLHLRDELAAWMVARGVDQWQPGEMPLSWLELCIASGWVYSVRSEELLVAAVTITWQDPFIWGDTEELAGYIHMLMVDRAYAGNGIGRSLLGWAESHIGASGRSLARLDCATSNQRLCAYYEQAGYQWVDRRNFRLADHETFPDVERLVDTALYEKSLSQ